MAADFYLGRKRILFEGGKFLEFGSSFFVSFGGVFVVAWLFFLNKQAL